MRDELSGFWPANLTDPPDEQEDDGECEHGVPFDEWCPDCEADEDDQDDDDDIDDLLDDEQYDDDELELDDDPVEP